MIDKKKNKFREIYDALPPRQVAVAPKTAWVKDIAQRFKTHPITVRCWLNGTQTPEPFKACAIADYLGVPVEGLFGNPNGDKN